MNRARARRLQAKREKWAVVTHPLDKQGPSNLTIESARMPIEAYIGIAIIAVVVMLVIGAVQESSKVSEDKHLCGMRLKMIPEEVQMQVEEGPTFDGWNPRQCEILLQAMINNGVQRALETIGGSK